jgi:cytochrome c peroxidase
MRLITRLLLLFFFSVNYSGVALGKIKETSAIDNIRLAAGDDKTAYARADYRTDSLSLEYRNGKVANLYNLATVQQLGLPLPPQPAVNQADQQKIALGRKLFFDRRLSRNQTMSCAMCHIPEQGFTNNELSRPVGFQGRGLKRNAPTILNVAYSKTLFADARESTLEQQAWSPLLAANEMNNPSIGFVIDNIKRFKDYDKLFERAFGAAPDMLNIGMALAQYERSLISANSKFDRWHFGAQKNALTTIEKQGYQLFTGKAGCVACHRINNDYALFTDELLHNTGVGYRDSMATSVATVIVQLAPGVTAQLDPAVLKSVGIEKPNDIGRYEVTLNPNDRWKYKTPSLRNVELTAPYMHTGEFLNLEQVLEFYNNGGQENKLLSPLIRPLKLSQSEQLAIVAFLKSLTGSNVRVLVADAFSAPIGDVSVNAHAIK